MTKLFGLLAGILICSAARAAEPAATPSTAPADAREEPVAVRVFRTLATFPAERTRILIEAGAALDEKARAELLRLIDEYGRKVDAAADNVRKAPPNLHTLMNQAQIELADNFEYDVLGEWLEVHPDAQAALQRIQGTLDDIAHGLEEDRQVIAAAVRAGLPESKQAEAKKIVDDILAESVAFGQRIQKLQQEGARLPEDHPSHLEAITILVEVEIHKLRATSRIRERIRDLLPPEQRGQFDEELAKLRAKSAPIRRASPTPRPSLGE